MQPDKDSRQVPGWTHSYSVASQQAADLGCYGSQHCCWFIRSPVVPVCWWCSWSRGEQKNVQVRWPSSHKHFSAFSVWDPRRHSLFSVGFSERGGWSFSRRFGRSLRNIFSLATHFGSHTAVQCHSDQWDILLPWRSTNSAPQVCKEKLQIDKLSDDEIFKVTCFTRPAVR